MQYYVIVKDSKLEDSKNMPSPKRYRRYYKKFRWENYSIILRRVII